MTYHPTLADVDRWRLHGTVGAHTLLKVFDDADPADLHPIATFIIELRKAATA